MFTLIGLLFGYYYFELFLRPALIYKQKSEKFQKIFKTIFTCWFGILAYGISLL